MLYKDGNEENRKLAEKLLARLHRAVLALDDTSFRVIQNRKAVQKFRKRETWERLTDMDVAELKEHIAPIIKGEDEDIAARFFDATMLRILYDFVSSKDIMARTQAVEETAEYLLTPTKQSIPQVKAKEPMLRAVQGTDFWLNATAARIEQVREELRFLMKFVEKEVTPRFYTDFTETVGMEHAAVKQAFAEFLQENRLNSRQMDFVKRIISYFEHNGILEKKDIATKDVFESAGNIEVLFKGKTAEVQQILAKVSEVTRNGTEIEIA